MAEVELDAEPPLPQPPSGMSSYEAQRLRNIEANQRMLASLGLSSATSTQPTTVAEAKRSRGSSNEDTPVRRRPKREAAVPARRSLRARGAQPDYTGERIDKFGDDASGGEDGSGSNSGSGERVRARLVTAQEANAAALARCKEVMEVHRQQFAALPLPAMGSATANAWQAEAARRWGPRVLHVANVHDWAAYVRSRTASPPPLLPSPYALLQERYAFDPWHLLVACVLMSRVSSAEVKERCLGGFFAACPTPSALLDTDPATLLPILRSLGLFPNRMSAIVDVTQRFLQMPEFDVGLVGDLKIRGVGEFGYQSYLIFCRDEDPRPSDKNLLAFVHWRNSMRLGAPSTLLDSSALPTPPAPVAQATQAVPPVTGVGGASGSPRRATKTEDAADGRQAPDMLRSSEAAVPCSDNSPSQAEGTTSVITSPLRRSSPRRTHVPVLHSSSADGDGANRGMASPRSAPPRRTLPATIEPSAQTQGSRRRGTAKTSKTKDSGVASMAKTATVGAAGRSASSPRRTLPATIETPGQTQRSVRQRSVSRSKSKVGGTTAQTTTSTPSAGHAATSAENAGRTAENANKSTENAGSAAEHSSSAAVAQGQGREHVPRKPRTIADYFTPAR